jgi:hypothetical protein
LATATAVAALPTDSDVQVAAAAAITAASLATASGVSGVPAAVDVTLTAAHGAGAWTGGGGGGITAQQTRDALALALTPGTVVASGLIDGKVDGVSTDVNGLENVVVTRASMADDGTTARFSVWLERLGVRMTTVTVITATVRDKDSVLVVNLGSGTGPSSDGTFSFSCASTTLPFGVPLSLRSTSTDGVSTWYGSIGFARS